MLTAFTLLICSLLIFIVLAQDPKSSGLAQGFKGAQQFQGIQRTAQLLVRSTWSLGIALIVLCLASATL